MTSAEHANKRGPQADAWLNLTTSLPLPSPDDVIKKPGPENFAQQCSETLFFIHPLLNCHCIVERSFPRDRLTF